jgi:ribosome maturation factor RimP
MPCYSWVATTRSSSLEVGALRPLFVRGQKTTEAGRTGRLTQVYERERELQREVAQRVAVSAPDVEVLAVELASAERFCVYIDHPEGVDHSLCERVTDLLRGYLDRYTVDVSSPGVERPLRSRGHFEAAAGRRVAVRTAVELDGRRRFRGRVSTADDDALALELESGSVEIPYASIVRANLIAEGRE